MTDTGKSHAGASGAARAPSPDTPADDRMEDKDESLRAVAERLIDSGRAYAEAEIGRQKLRAVLAGSALRAIAIFVTIALILLFGTLVTLLVGLVLALSPMLTPLGATAAVSIATLLVVALLLLMARRHMRSLIALMKEP